MLRTSRNRRAAFVVALALLALLATPAAALASTATMVDGALTYSAAPGERNRVFIFTGTAYRIVDLGATITPGPGCSAVSSEEVVCPIPAEPAATDIAVSAGDLDDFVFLNTFGSSIANAEGEDTRVLGEDGADHLEVIAPFAMNTIDGGAGADTLKAGAGQSTLLGGPGPDELNGEPAPALAFLTSTYAAADYSDRTNPVTADVDGVADDGEAGEGDNLIAIDIIFGGSAGDTLSGPHVNGGAGDDTLVASASSERDVSASGGDGDDVITTDILADRSATLSGGPGDDAMTAGPRGFHFMLGRGGDDLLIGHDGQETDQLEGGRDSDIVRGREGGDVLIGDAGPDLLVGGSGGDRLFGDGGRDTLRARDGSRDEVDGGPGHDRARVDRGLDVVRFIEELF